MSKSIRWWLPLSYAAIALLVALALGAVLLVTLRGYYMQLERDYLASNAQAISTNLVEADLPLEVLQSQLDIFAFLSQAQVHVLDADGQLVAASTAPENLYISSAAVPATYTWLPGESIEMLPFYQGMIIVQPAIGPDVFTVTADTFPSYSGERDGVTVQSGTIVFKEMPVAGTPFGFGLGGEVALDGPRSNQVERQPYYDDEGRLQSYVELAEGPAYGREIVNSVARGWALASAVAVALAAVVGWLISRRMSVPLLTLTNVTAAMAAGDLSARAQVHGEDEIGALALSFNLMADRVEGTVVTLRRFVSDAAHELYAPLATLRTNLEMMRQDTLPWQDSLPEQDRTLSQDRPLVRAQDQVARLEALTRNLLNLSRLESEAQVPDLAPVSLTALVREASEVFASRAEQARIGFELSLPETSITVSGDETQLQQALTNLLDNALKFTPEGGSVRLVLSQEGELTVLRIEDTGIGIPEADLPHLFQRFHRGGNTSAYPGSGLGLAIVKAIAERHGGSVTVTATDQGARFTLRLPVK